MLIGTYVFPEYIVPRIDEELENEIKQLITQ